MHDFHYNFIKKYFDAEFLFTETNSFTYDIRRRLWRISKNKYLFFFSNYPKDSKFFDLTNENVIRKM